MVTKSRRQATDPIRREQLRTEFRRSGSRLRGLSSGFLLGIEVAPPDEVDPDRRLRDHARGLYWESFREKFPTMSAADCAYLAHLFTFVGCVTRKVWEVHGRQTERPTVRHVEIARTTYRRVAETEFALQAQAGPVRQINEPCPFCAPDDSPGEQKKRR